MSVYLPIFYTGVPFNLSIAALSLSLELKISFPVGKVASGLGLGIAVGAVGSGDLIGEIPDEAIVSNGSALS